MPVYEIHTDDASYQVQADSVAINEHGYLVFYGPLPEPRGLLSSAPLIAAERRWVYFEKLDDK